MSQSNVVARETDKRGGTAAAKGGMRRVNRTRLLRPVLMIGGGFPADDICPRTIPM
jgi:hypothetical protein